MSYVETSRLSSSLGLVEMFVSCLVLAVACVRVSDLVTSVESIPMLAAHV